MRSELEKECRMLFRRMMTAEFPEYLEDKVQVVPGNRYIRTLHHPSGIWFHIIMMPHPTKDKFTIEGAWDFNGKLMPLEIVEENDKFKIFERPIMFRPNFFWSGKDYWWPLVLFPEVLATSISYKDDPLEDCFPLVAPAIQDAAQKIKEYVLPLFEKVVKKHGSKSGAATNEPEAGCAPTYRQLGAQGRSQSEKRSCDG
jgi:hypothetical protein